MQASKDLTVSSEQLALIAENFAACLQQGLAGRHTPLKMLSSFLPPPTGGEKGVFLSLDLGGSNARASEVRLLGNRALEIANVQHAPLRDQPEGYDYTSSKATAGELFDFLACLVAKAMSANKGCDLGFTFSFPSRQISLTEAELITWTKEFQTYGVVGQDVGRMLRDALAQRLLPVRLKAIVNDTVAALLAARYAHPTADIGSILGTGHNTCYLEPSSNRLINLESGNFDRLPQTHYDLALDKASGSPGKQTLEKMVGGKYLGELFRLMLADRIKTESILSGAPSLSLSSPYALSAADMSLVLNDSTPGLAAVGAWLDRAGYRDSFEYEREAVKETAAKIACRSARLAAGTFLGILKHLDPGLNRPHTIGVDGSLFGKMPGYAAHICQALQEVLGQRDHLVSVIPVPDGSQSGAAVAAALG